MSAIAGFQAERGAIDGDVGARFVDDADHADRHAEPADLESVGAHSAVEFLAHGIGEGGDLPDTLGDLGDAVGGERQAVDLCARQVVRLGCRLILRIGGEQGVL